MGSGGEVGGPADQAVRGRVGPSDRAFKRIAVLAGLCLVGFIVFVAVRPAAKDGRTLGVASLKAAPPPVLHAGTVAPPFSLPRLGGGTPVSLASFRGGPVMVNFFASWCPDCRSELAAIASVAAPANGGPTNGGPSNGGPSNGGIAVVGVDSNDGNGAAAAKLLTAAHAAYPVGVDTSAKVASAYLLTALPVTYFVNAQGRVVGSALGPQSVTSLRRWVRRLTGSP